MDPSGKLIYTRNNEVLSSNLQTVSDDTFVEGSRISLSVKELGSTEIFPTSLNHSPNGRFVTVVGDGEYIIYTALAWRNKAFGTGNSFAWASDSNTYAVLEGKLQVHVFKNFKERPGPAIKGLGSWIIDGLHGGTLLGGRGNTFVVFWDWETGEIVRRIDVEAKNVRQHQQCPTSAYPLLHQVFWSLTGTLVAIAADESFYILRYDRDAYTAKVEAGIDLGDEGVEEAFEVVTEVPEK